MQINKQKQDEVINHERSFSFVPRRLEIASRLELYNFPLNVLFMSQTVKNGKNVIASALYEPDFHTYQQKDDLSLMRYHNIYDSKCFLIISYDNQNKRYLGQKYVNGELAGSAIGKDNWDLFFTHLTMIGLVDNEKCRFEFEIES